MTYNSIAKLIFYNEKYGNLIARENGYDDGNTPVPESATVRIPQNIQANNYNKAWLFAGYDEQQIIGGFYPSYAPLRPIEKIGRAHV